MKRIINVLLILFACQELSAQVPKTINLLQGTSSPTPQTNVINDILPQHDTIWCATDKGPSYTVNGGNTWINLSNTSAFDEKGISAIAAIDDIIWMATGYTTKLGDIDVPTGGGLHYSTDHGISWHFISQPIDSGTVDTLNYGNNRIRTLDVTVPQQNITYDIALTHRAVWIASWAGMLRKSEDMGATWQRIILPPDNLDSIKPSDSLSFDLSPSSGRLGLSANLNHLLFSVYAGSDSIIWAGTAGGINKSTDGGVSWQKYNHQNQSKSICGNFVVAIKEQLWTNHRIIWAATNTANDPTETRGISFSENGGNSWQTGLIGAFTHNIAFKDSIVYVATDQGIYRSDDIGKIWIRNGTIYDPANLQRFVSNDIYCVATAGDTIWIGSGEGVAYTVDNSTHPFGTQWKVFHTSPEIGTSLFTYAYPNPFSPDLDVTRIHYSTKSISSASSLNVDIRLFNFSMQPVRTLIQRASRRAGMEFDEIWNGKDDRGFVVANGVYFYYVSVGDNTPVWGKILVVR